MMKMKETVKNQSKSVVESILEQAVAQVTLDTAVSEIKDRESSDTELKWLTMSLAKSVPNENPVEMVKVAQMVRLWSEDKSIKWRNNLVEYAKTHEDIESVLYKTVDGKGFFLIISSTQDADIILEHNEFCFVLFDKYEDISDFTVLELGEYKSMKNFYQGYAKIYKRG